MRLWFVTPCWRRPEITRVCLAQRRDLCDRAAAEGVTADCIVVADDENLDVAAEYGFPVIEMENRLGRKVNAGFKYALEHDADVVAFTGSDSWVHPDLITEIDGEHVLTGKRMCHVDMRTGRYDVFRSRQRFGVTPWFIPAAKVPQVPDTAERGMEFWMFAGIPNGEWKYADPHDFSRVELKSAVNMTPYTGGNQGNAWDALKPHYPSWLLGEALIASMMPATATETTYV